MIRNTHSEGHTGGTCAPAERVRRCRPTQKRVSRLLRRVPQRALERERYGKFSAETRGFRALSVLRGTKGHARSHESIGVHGSAS